MLEMEMTIRFLYGERRKNEKKSESHHERGTGN